MIQEKKELKDQIPQITKNHFESINDFAHKDGIVLCQ